MMIELTQHELVIVLAGLEELKEQHSQDIQSANDGLISGEEGMIAEKKLSEVYSLFERLDREL